MSSLLDLPDEILLQIISKIDAHRESRILGHDPDFPYRIDSRNYTVAYHKACNILINLALTCKRLRPLVAEQIVFAPVLTERYPFLPRQNPLRSYLRTFGLISTLRASPKLRRHVKQLSLTLAPKSDSDLNRDSDLSPTVVKKTCALIDSLDLPSSTRLVLRQHAKYSSFETLVPVLLMHAPQLQRLCIARSDEYYMPQEPERPCCFLKVLPFHTLEYLKFDNFVLLDVDHLSSCVETSILDLGIAPEKFRHFQSELTPSTYTELLPLEGRLNRPITVPRHLRIDFRTRLVGVWNHSTRIYMVDLLQKFKHLVSLDFYAEPTGTKNPYSSVRAFPHYQANIQNYPEESGDLPTDVSDDCWDQMLYAARTEVTDYQNLVDSIIHLRPTLETLRLPGGFWTLPGGMRKPLPLFGKFTQLQKLVLPQAAIIAIRLDNMRFDEVAGDFDLSPKTALPPGLRHLEVFDVDGPFLQSPWLLDFFGAQLAHKHWPAFQHLEIRMGYTVGDEELNMLKVLKAPTYRTFCALAQAAPFSVRVRRDDDVPMLWSSWD